MDETAWMVNNYDGTHRWDDFGTTGTQGEGFHGGFDNIFCVDGHVESLLVKPTWYGYLGVADNVYPQYWDNSESIY